MSIFGWSYPAGCSGTPYDDDRPEVCPQCGRNNSNEEGEPVCVDAPDFCSVACQDTYLAEEAEYERKIDAMLDKAERKEDR
jgi:hypothetical protein